VRHSGTDTRAATHAVAAKHDDSDTCIVVDLVVISLFDFNADIAVICSLGHALGHNILIFVVVVAIIINIVNSITNNIIDRLVAHRLVGAHWLDGVHLVIVNESSS